MNKQIELLAPAGDMEKLKTALHFGADAVYFAGKNFGLRAFGSNFTDDQLKEAVALVHQNNKKAYITINVYARNNDFEYLKPYLKFLEDIKIDAVLISDMGVFNFVKKYAPKLVIHISTQANTTNKYAVEAYKNMGASRVVLARELSIEEISQISKHNPDVELEAFVHGAMCISYSGRCLLSNYLTGRDSNHGECVQACRWKYYVTEESRPNEPLQIEEDDKGTYIFNSKDLCLIEHLDKIADAGVTSFKIEGRMKSPYYVATVVNAYRKAIDTYYNCRANNTPYKVESCLLQELNKTSHRQYTTGFMINNGQIKQNLLTSSQEQESKFIAIVTKVLDDAVVVEQRNKFSKGDVLEILSPNLPIKTSFTVQSIINSKGENIIEAKHVQEQLTIYGAPKGVMVGDILRK